MKLKSDFNDVFIIFQKYIENQFDRKIKVFQCDGEGKFISTKFQNHLQACGVKNYISCPYTLGKNGISERKHRHVVELGLAMLYHVRILLIYWVDSFLTTNYIINMLLTPNLHMDSPHSRLYGQKLSYDHLRIFGCACYPCLRPYVQHKFDPRSLTCVFLGYSERHKGYYCLVPTDGRIYISWNVTFDKSFFPFAKKLNAGFPHYTTLYQKWVEEVGFLF